MGGWHCASCGVGGTEGVPCGGEDAVLGGLQEGDGAGGGGVREGKRGHGQTERWNVSKGSGMGMVSPGVVGVRMSRPRGCWGIWKEF